MSENLTGDARMEQFHIPSSAIAEDIEIFAASYMSPLGVPWNSRVYNGPRRENYVIKLWNGKVQDNHLCWARFNVRQSDESTVMDVTVCSESHDSGKVKEHIVHSLWKSYGSN